MHRKQASVHHARFLLLALMSGMAWRVLPTDRKVERRHACARAHRAADALKQPCVAVVRQVAALVHEEFAL